MSFQDFLQMMVDRNASDIYFTNDAPPMYRIEGITQPIGDGKFSPKDLEILARSIMNDHQWSEFIAQKEMNLALSISKLSRFRVNAFWQRGSIGLVVRKIVVEIPTLAQLGLPDTLKDIIMAKRGLVLVVGATGSGKSTSLAAMIDHRNRSSAGHIVTVEDPVEFVHQSHQ